VKGKVFIALLVYVDDIVLARNNSQACKDFKNYLHACFSIKDLGPLKHFLGIEVAWGPQGMFLCQCIWIEVAWGPQGMFLCQRKYALEILQECGLFGAKLAEFPFEEGHKPAWQMDVYWKMLLSIVD